MLTKIRPVDTASQLSWTVKPGRKWEFGSSGEYLHYLAIQRAQCKINGPWEFDKRKEMFCYDEGNHKNKFLEVAAVQY